jgi:hypothetical protein
MSEALRADGANQVDATAGATGEADGAKAVWFFSGDLLFASRIQSAAQRRGVAFLLMGKWPETWTTRPGWVIVDLATRSGGSADIRQRTGEQFPDAITIAYGPHVQPARLSKARQDGFAAVMTRGQFDAALPDLFQ